MGTLAVGAEVDLPKPGQKWIEVRTANFRFFSNAGKAATRQVAVDLEELRAVLGELTDFRRNCQHQILRVVILLPVSLGSKLGDCRLDLGHRLAQPFGQSGRRRRPE